MEGKHFSYSGDYLDRLIQSRESSVVNKFQRKYWKTRQTSIRVTGKKEDEHVVASDADSDAKSEVFHSIQRTCMESLKVIESYQRRICYLSQEENESGRFSRSQGSQDKSRAGKIMQATGKALCFSSQQRSASRKPSCRLYQEIETFRYRAISDTWSTVNRMEQSRTEYRGALLWMKDVSQELDPDTQKQMEKFRKVQAQVRTTKTCFDKLKNDVCQKVDSSGASRCNLLSHVSTTYQTTLLHFWGKTSHTMAAIHESFKACQNNEVPTSKASQDSIDKSDKKMEKTTTKAEPEDKRRNETTDDESISLGHEDKSKMMTKESDEEKDSSASLNEISGGLFVVEDDCSSESRKGFGETEEGGALTGPAETQQRQENSFFLPSQLLDQSLNMSSLSGWTVPQPMTHAAECPLGAEQNPQQPAVKETTGTTKDLSTWFNSFADLDPLSNPDAVGKSNREHELHTA